MIETVAIHAQKESIVKVDSKLGGHCDENQKTQFDVANIWVIA